MESDMNFWDSDQAVRICAHTDVGVMEAAESLSHLSFDHDCQLRLLLLEIMAHAYNPKPLDRIGMILQRIDCPEISRIAYSAVAYVHQAHSLLEMNVQYLLWEISKEYVSFLLSMMPMDWQDWVSSVYIRYPDCPYEGPIPKSPAERRALNTSLLANLLAKNEDPQILAQLEHPLTDDQLSELVMSRPRYSRTADPDPITCFRRAEMAGIIDDPLCVD
jgi:hypothetical protein